MVHGEAQADSMLLPGGSLAHLAGESDHGPWHCEEDAGEAPILWILFLPFHVPLPPPPPPRPTSILSDEGRDRGSVANYGYLVCTRST